MASNLLSLLNGGLPSSSATPPQQNTASSPPPPATGGSSLTASSSQGTTIDQLFARMANPGGQSSTPPPSQQNTFSTPPFQNGGHSSPPIQDPTPKRNALLDMLSSGTSPSTSMDFMPQPGAAASLGPVGSPSPSGGSRSPPFQEDRAQNLLAALMGGGTPTPDHGASSPPHNLAMAHSQPILNHPSSPPTNMSPHPDSLPPPLSFMNTDTTPSPAPSPAAVPPPKADAKTSEPPKEEPKKTIFNFVSPFDAFDDVPKPAPSPAAPAQTDPKPVAAVPGPSAPSPAPSSGATKKVKKEKTKPDGKGDETDRSTGSKEGKVKVKEETPAPAEEKGVVQKVTETLASVASVLPGIKTESPAPAPEQVQTQASLPPSRTATPVQDPSATPNVSTPSKTTGIFPDGAASPSAKRRLPIINIPYPASGFAPKGSRANKAALFTGNKLKIDVSKPNADSIVTDLKPVVDRKISLVATDVLTAGPTTNGTKLISGSGKMIAYALTKSGRVRVLDQTSGKNALIEFPVDENGRSQKVMDIAVTMDKYLAAVSYAGWVVIWEIESIKMPGKTGEDDVECKLLLVQKPDGYGGAIKVLWPKQQVDTKVTLLMGTKYEVYSLFFVPSAIKKGDSPLMMATCYEGKEPQLLVDFCYKEGADDSETLLLFDDGELKTFNILSSEATSVHLSATYEGYSQAIKCSAIELCADNLLVSYGGGRAYRLISLSDLEYPEIYIKDVETDDDTDLLIQFEGVGETIGSEIGVSVATYDKFHELLFIASFPRSSLYTTSIKKNSNGSWSVRYMEIPGETMGNIAVQESSGPNAYNGNSEILFKYPKGFSQYVFKKPLVSELLVQPPAVAPKQAAAPPAPAPAATASTPQELRKATHSPQPMVVLPKPKEVQVPAAVESSKQAVAPAAVSSTAQPAQAASAGVSEAQLEKMEERLFARLSKSLSEQIQESGVAQIAQFEKIQLQNQSADVQRQETVIRLISESLNRDVKNTLASIVQQELRSSVLPVIQETVHAEVSKVAGPQLAAIVNESIQSSVMVQIERSLMPHLSRTFQSVLSPIVEQKVQQLMETDLVPRYVEATRQVHGEMTSTMAGELSSLRQAHLDQLSSRQSPDPMFQQLSTQLSQMSDQLRTMNSEVQALKARPMGNSPVGPPPPPPQHPSSFFHPAPPPTLPGHNPQFMQSPPVQQSAPSAPREDAEETFLQAFGTLSNEGIMDFITARQNQVTYYLPNPVAGRSPLSQAVLLTIIHKLSHCLIGKSPSSHPFQIAMSWIFRAANLIESADPNISSYLPKIRDSLSAHYRQVISQMPDDGTGSKGGAIQTMNQVMGILSRAQ